MDEGVRLFLENLSKQFAALEIKIDNFHTPANCILNERIRELELNQARQRGALVIIGAIAGVVAGGIISWFVKR